MGKRRKENEEKQVKRFELKITEFDEDSFSILWKSKKVPKEVVITILDPILSKFKDQYRTDLMGDTKPF